jgi:hypothetical protein
LLAAADLAVPPKATAAIPATKADSNPRRVRADAMERVIESNLEGCILASGESGCRGVYTASPLAAGMVKHHRNCRGQI